METTNTMGAATPQSPHDVLDAILEPLAASPQTAFQDSDGLISFVNLSSEFVQHNPEFKIGQALGDKVSNFMATLRQKTFTALTSGAIKPLAGDPPPRTQWDKAVTHYMFYLLTEAGGFANFKITTETYSVTQVITEFSTDFVKLLFDAAVVPEAVIADVTNFLQGVGKSLRFSWDDRSRTYSTTLLGQVHEAVQEDASGKNFRYFPKIKFYSIDVASHQQEFATPCSDTKKITFDFQYEYYVTALVAATLDPHSATSKQFNGFLDRAQGVNHKDADNNLDKIMGGTTSAMITAPGAPGVNTFGVDLTEYPLTAGMPPSAIELLLNDRG